MLVGSELVNINRTPTRTTLHLSHEIDTKWPYTQKQGWRILFTTWRTQTLLNCIEKKSLFFPKLWVFYSNYRLLIQTRSYGWGGGGLLVEAFLAIFFSSNSYLYMKCLTIRDDLYRWIFFRLEKTGQFDRVKTERFNSIKCS